MALGKGQSGKTWLSSLIALALLATAIPLVSAFEAHAINVTVHVKERFNINKAMRLATATEISEFQTLAASANITLPPGTPNVGVTDPANVPIETYIVWLVTITASNPHDYPITDVTVADRFSAELGGIPMGTEVVDLFIVTHSRGKSKKEIFETQYRITWYVTWNESMQDNLDEMAPGESDFLQLYLWTKLNPSGRQEYTSPGTYTMNSGPVMKWFDLGGQQFSAEGAPLFIQAQ